MKMVKELLKTREQIKKRKPTFRRQQINQFAKFKNDDAWRRPKGLQSKMRLKRRGYRKMPTVGFKSPKLVRGLNRDGLLEVIVRNISDLQKIDSKNQIAVIGRTVGGKKKIDILTEAKKLKISFSNIVDIDKKIKKLLEKTKISKKKKDKKAVKSTKKKAKTKSNKKTKVQSKKTKEETK